MKMKGHKFPRKIWSPTLLLKMADYDESTMIIRNQSFPSSEVILRSFQLTPSAHTYNNSFIAQASEWVKNYRNNNHNNVLRPTIISDF